MGFILQFQLVRAGSQEDPEIKDSEGDAVPPDNRYDILAVWFDNETPQSFDAVIQVKNLRGPLETTNSAKYRIDLFQAEKSPDKKMWSYHVDINIPVNTVTCNENVSFSLTNSSGEAGAGVGTGEGTPIQGSIDWESGRMRVLIPIVYIKMWKDNITFRVRSYAYFPINVGLKGAYSFSIYGLIADAAPDNWLDDSAHPLYTYHKPVNATSQSKNKVLQNPAINQRKTSNLLPGFECMILLGAVYAVVCIRKRFA